MIEFNYKFQDNFKAYFNPARYYSYTDINMFILIGGRGIGKTTGIVKQALRRYATYGDEFIYCRRYKTEIAKSKDLLSLVVNDPTSTKGVGNGIFQYTYDKHRLGYGAALSMQASYKSGMDFSKVTTFIYDEALIEAGGTMRYLTNEINELLEFISTMARSRTNYRVFVLSNNVDLFNPYFAYFNLPKFSTSYMDKDRGLYAEIIPTKEALLKIEEKTPLYRLTKGTPYGEYHYNNEILTTQVGTIGNKPKKSALMCRIIYENFTLNIYRTGILDIYVEFRDKAIDDNLSFTMLKDNLPNYTDIKAYRTSDLYGIIRRCYDKGKVVYNHQKAVAIMAQFMEEV